jgi:hypothetical protein
MRHICCVSISVRYGFGAFDRLAALRGDPEGQCRCGIALQSGREDSADLSAAAHYFKLTADQNHNEAQYRYARSLSLGSGIPINLCEAAKYFKLAADQNHAKAEYRYARSIFLGYDIPVNLCEAVKYFKLAADQNHAKAHYHYARSLSLGYDIPVHLCEAAKYFKLAADQNHAKAQYRYVRCLSLCYGNPIDFVMSRPSDRGDCAFRFPSALSSTISQICGIYQFGPGSDRIRRRGSAPAFFGAFRPPRKRINTVFWSDPEKSPWGSEQRNQLDIRSDATGSDLLEAVGLLYPALDLSTRYEIVRVVIERKQMEVISPTDQINANDSDVFHIQPRLFSSSDNEFRWKRTPD